MPGAAHRGQSQEAALAGSAPRRLVPTVACGAGGLPRPVRGASASSPGDTRTSGPSRGWAPPWPPRVLGTEARGPP